MQLVKLLTHCLHLLFRCLQLGRLVAVFHELRINGFGKAFGHLLGTRPVHILDKQVASHRPQLGVTLQQLSHCFQSLLALGCVAWACCHHHVVLADAWVVDFVDHHVVLHDLLDWLFLHRVNLDHLSFAVQANDASHALCVVNLGDQVHKLAHDVTYTTGQVVAVMVSAHIALALAGQNGFA